MHKILFVCHGNICRSPMAEFVMKQMVQQAGLAEQFVIASAATSREELGNPVYPPAQKILLRHGINPSGKTARQICAHDYEEFHYLIGMDSANIVSMRKCYHGDPDSKIFRLLNLVPQARDIADPWYTGHFEDTWHDVTEGCAALLQFLQK